MMAQEGFAIGTVISTSLAVFSRNLVPFSLIALVIGIPYIVVGFSDSGSIDPAMIEQTGQIPSGFWAMAAIGFLIYLLTYMLTQSAIVFGTFQDLRGQRASTAACLARGLATLPPVVVAALLASIGVAIGSMLLLIPGIILMLMWWVLVPVLVVEGGGIMDSFGRSRDLTRGHRWGILGLLLIVGVVQWLIDYLLGLISPVLGVFGAELLSMLVVLFFSAFASVMVAVGYYYLRAEKEGIVVDDIARIFD